MAAKPVAAFTPGQERARSDYGEWRRLVARARLLTRHLEDLGTLPGDDKVPGQAIRVEQELRAVRTRLYDLGQRHGWRA